jgi:two-component system KDP operon response regulator KdpE
MGAGADLLEPVGRPVTPAELLREPAPSQPVLLVGPADGWDAAGVTPWLDHHGWSWTTAVDADRARWLASIQRMSLVIVAGTEADVWCTVEATRPVTMAPIVVLGVPPPPGVVALVGAGVDAVVDPGCGVEEIFARVMALLRRSDNGWEPGVRYLLAGGLRVDLVAQECHLDGRLLHLSPTEYSLLTFLMTHPLEALSIHVIVRRVWGWLPSDGKNALRIFVNRLRRKLGDDPRQPVYIASVRGTGYRFIRNVTEMGHEAEPAAEGSETAPLLSSIEHLAVTLQTSSSSIDAAECLLAALDATGYADAMAVFRVDGDSMRLVAHRDMPAAWVSVVAAGVPLQPTFASAQSVLSREPVQFGDIKVGGQHFPATAERLTCGGYHACLFLPILAGDQVWGHLGLARRARQPFDPTGTAYLRAMCAVFSLATSVGGGGRLTG